MFCSNMISFYIDRHTSCVEKECKHFTFGQSYSQDSILSKIVGSSFAAQGEGQSLSTIYTTYK